MRGFPLIRRFEIRYDQAGVASLSILAQTAAVCQRMTNGLAIGA